VIKAVGETVRVAIFGDVTTDSMAFAEFLRSPGTQIPRWMSENGNLSTCVLIGSGSRFR
jgi:hypothetical protein